MPGAGPFSCGRGESVDWQGGALTWAGEIKCDDGLTISVHDSEETTWYWRRARIEIPEAGDYSFDVDTWRVSVGLTRCLTSSAEYEDRAPSDFDVPVADEWSTSRQLLEAMGGGIGYTDGPLFLHAGVYDLWVGQDVRPEPYTFEVKIVGP